jgi:uncharacterized protein YndB with AHSA1/START domain
MLQRPEPACLVIADISGYTSYIAGTELDHAQDILADLIGTVVGALRPTFRLAKLEGDAAFTYAMTETIDGSALQDTVERCYYAFRRRLRDIHQASTCDCNACTLMPTLDLKFVTHHGPVIRQRIAGRDELAGANVIVAHRLLKNDVVETLGIAAYALYSEAAVAAMGLEDPAAAGLVAHRQTYDGVGEIGGWVRDLEAAWQAESERTRVFVDATEAIWAIETIVPAPPEIAWEWFTSPARRPQWQAGVTEVREETPSGRRGVGTTNHCIHGRDAIVEEILDWRPVDYQTIRVQIPAADVPKFTMTDLLEPVPTGTRLTTRVLRPRSAKDRAAFEAVVPMLDASVRAGVDALIPLIEADMAARATASAEPALPVSGGRYASRGVDVATAVDSAPVGSS